MSDNKRCLVYMTDKQKTLLFEGEITGETTHSYWVERYNGLPGLYVKKSHVKIIGEENERGIPKS